MTILCWNCKGLANPQTVRELCRKVNEKCPDLVFLMETKLCSKKMTSVKQKLGFKNILIVDSISKSSGLALLWKDKAGMEILSYSLRHINATIKPPNMNKWTFTRFYGHLETHR